MSMPPLTTTAISMANEKAAKRVVLLDAVNIFLSKFEPLRPVEENVIAPVLHCTAFATDCNLE